MLRKKHDIEIMTISEQLIINIEKLFLRHKFTTESKHKMAAVSLTDVKENIQVYSFCNNNTLLYFVV